MALLMGVKRGRRRSCQVIVTAESIYALQTCEAHLPHIADPMVPQALAPVTFASLYLQCPKPT